MSKTTRIKVQTGAFNNPRDGVRHLQECLNSTKVIMYDLKWNIQRIQSTVYKLWLETWL